MIAPNHALTGAIIGLSISNPLVALPLAFLSHFVLDAIPHYDPSSNSEAEMYRSKRFVLEFLVIGGVLCFVVVLLLFVAKPQHWLQAAICAFLATTPDLSWLPRFISVRRTGKGIDISKSNWFWRLHDWVQWKTGPKFYWVEIAWFVSIGAIFAAKL